MKKLVSVLVLILVVAALSMNAFAQEEPTGTPTEAPTGEPTGEPTVAPTEEPIPFEGGLIVNGSFEDGQEGWDVKNAGKDKVKTNKPEKEKFFALHGDSAFQFKGAAGAKVKLVQKVSVDGIEFVEGEGLVFSAAYNSKKEPAVKFKAVVKFNDETEKVKLGFSAAQTTEYAFGEDSAVLPSVDVKSVKVTVVSKTTSGKVFVDNVSLFATSVVVEPTATPTTEPTTEPTEEPTGLPTEVPTEEPTGEPTEVPTEEPTGEPTEAPTGEPTEEQPE